jgi:NTE family protein
MTSASFSIRRRLLCAGLAAPACLLGCDAVPPLLHPPRYDEKLLAPPPRLLLVLGGGGPRGYAHVGVLRALDEAGIVADCVVGSSVGALIGSLYAAGRTGAQLDTLAREIQPTQLAALNLFSPRRLSLSPLAAWVNTQLDGALLQQLPRRLLATTAMAADGTQRVFNTGDAGWAVAASCALPDYFAPVTLEGVSYIDGDVASPVPIKLARSLSPACLIAVDCSAYIESTPAGASAQMRSYDQRRKAQVDAERPFADLVLHPDIGYWAPFSTAARLAAIEAGYVYTRGRLDEVRQILARRGLAGQRTS